MWKEGAMDFTGAQMILTLKLIAIAICYQDGARDQSSLHAYAKAKSLNRLPSPLEYISYLLSAGNLLAGPFYEAKDYFDYMQRKGEWDQSKPEYRLPNPIVPGLLRFIKAFACLAIWFSLSQRYGVEFLESKEWREETPLPRRVLLLWACLVIYRFKYYFAWALAECGLIFSGLCFNGYDDKGTPQWNRCINARIRKVELNESLADLPRHWNISTGNWLRNCTSCTTALYFFSSCGIIPCFIVFLIFLYLHPCADVYERLPGRDGKPTFANMFVTQLVSGLWHGLFPGYWMMFISTAFMFDSSKMLYRYEQNWSPALRAFPLYRLFKIVLTATVLDYTAAPFMILSFQESWLVWKSVYFFGHIFIFVVMLVGMVMPPRRKKSKGTETQSATELKTE